MGMKPRGLSTASDADLINELSGRGYRLGVYTGSKKTEMFFESDNNIVPKRKFFLYAPLNSILVKEWCDD